jgi:hypothetical protein
MPANKIGEFVKRLGNLERKMETHLMESGSIQTQLKVNTWLTGCIFSAIAVKLVIEFFFK